MFIKKNLIYGVFDDADKLLHTVESFSKKGIAIYDCYTPFPVHHLDKAMGIRRSWLSVAAFLCGLTGFSLGLFMQFYMMVQDWPMIIGGKPTTFRMLPSMVPVTFECTILCTAFGMGILFFIKSKMAHGIKADVIDNRQTDHKLILALDQSTIDEKVAHSELMSHGALEINVYNSETRTSTLISELKSKSTVVEDKKLESTISFDKINSLKSKLSPVNDGVKDDLKVIKGIGEVFETKLNEIGIFSFEQLANLTDEAKELIEDITGFPGRIDREDWIGQAKSLKN